MPNSFARTAGAVVGALAAFIVLDRFLRSQGPNWSHARYRQLRNETNGVPRSRIPGAEADATLHDLWKASIPKKDDVVFVETNADAVLLTPSAHICDDKELLFRVCIFQNLFYYQGWLMYIVADEAAREALQLPDLTLFEVGNTPPNGFTVAERITVITLAEVQSKLAAEASGAKVPGTLQVAEFQNSILQRTRSMNHIFWGMNGASNIFLRLCKYLDACTMEEVQAAAILQPSNVLHPAFRLGVSKAIQAISDLFECFGPILGINPYGSTEQPHPDNRIIFLRNMVAGIGEEVGEPHSAKGPNQEVRFKRPTPELALARQRHFRQCAGLPRDPPPATGASVLLVNRPHNDGRHIVELDDVYDQLVRTLPSDIPVRLYYPRAEGLHAQASVFSSANVLVVPHGAANANFAFLPHKATIFALYAVENRHILDFDHAKALPLPPYNITVVSVDCSEDLQANSQKLMTIPEFAQLSPSAKAFLLSDSTASKKKFDMLKKLLNMSSRVYMKYADYTIDPEPLAKQVAEAAMALHAELQQPTMS